MSTTTISTPSPVAARTRPRLSPAWLGFLVVLASAVMDLLDSTIAQTAAPAIQRDLGGSYAALEWITAAYTLAMSATLLLGSVLLLVWPAADPPLVRTQDAENREPAA